MIQCILTFFGRSRDLFYPSYRSKTETLFFPLITEKNAKESFSSVFIFQATAMANKYNEFLKNDSRSLRLIFLMIRYV